MVRRRKSKPLNRNIQTEAINKGERKMLDKLEKNQMKMIIITLLQLLTPKKEGRNHSDDMECILRNICINAGIIV